MTSITINTKKALFTTTLALILSACGGSPNKSTQTTDDKDNTEVSYKSINNCENNSTNAIKAQATIVPANTQIRKNGEDTVLRVWHFQNSEELICVVKGSADILL